MLLKQRQLKKQRLKVRCFCSNQLNRLINRPGLHHKIHRFPKLPGTDDAVVMESQIGAKHRLKLL